MQRRVHITEERTWLRRHIAQYKMGALLTPPKRSLTEMTPKQYSAESLISRRTDDRAAFFIRRAAIRDVRAGTPTYF
jgi:hypothetical protein